jgi:hypothetical protein
MKPSVHGQTLACGRSTEGSQEEEKNEPSCPLQRTGKRQLVNREALPPRQSTCGIEAIKASKMSGRTVDEIGRRKDEIERTSGIQQESRGGTRPREELDKPRGSKPSRFRRLKPIKPQAISLTTSKAKVERIAGLTVSSRSGQEGDQVGAIAVSRDDRDGLLSAFLGGRRKLDDDGCLGPCMREGSDGDLRSDVSGSLGGVLLDLSEQPLGGRLPGVGSVVAGTEGGEPGKGRGRGKGRSRLRRRRYFDCDKP